MYEIDDKKLVETIVKKSQWPLGEREVQYQSIGTFLPGIRNMEHRYSVMQLPLSFKEKTVLDIGCNLGMLSFEVKRRGAKRVVGIDYDNKTIKLAKNLVEIFDLDVEFYVFNINDGLMSLQNLIGAEKFDYIFALSIWAHVGKEELADIINYYNKRYCYFEGHATMMWLGDTKNKIESELKNLLNFRYLKYLGETSDRFTRHNYRITK